MRLCSYVINFLRAYLPSDVRRSIIDRHVGTAEESSKKWPKMSNFFVVVSAAITITRNYRFSRTTAKSRRRGPDPLALMDTAQLWRGEGSDTSSAAPPRESAPVGAPRRLDDKVPREIDISRWTSSGHRSVTIVDTLWLATGLICIKSMFGRITFQLLIEMSKFDLQLGIGSSLTNILTCFGSF